MINILIFLYNYLFNEFGITIIVLTIIIRSVMYPLTKKQLHATRAMQSLQPQLQEIQKKYAKDKAKLAREQMRIYKESGISPAGCMVPMLIQMPIWIALYQSIMLALAVAPEGLLNLSRYLYDWQFFSILPLGKVFLGMMNLAEPNILLAILVGGTMWLQQKMVTPPTTDPRQGAQARMMLWMMPLMFTFLSMSFPSGLALYWVASNVITIVMQYLISGWGSLTLPGMTKSTSLSTRDKRYRGRIAQVEEKTSISADTGADIVVPSSTHEKGSDYGKSGDKRQDRGGSYSTRLGKTRRQSGRNKDHGPKRK
ncbi:YidC/Oxa1 family membrane protein insertase [Chloroflexota bacterium]